jgi:hypothetical protein
MGWLGPVHFPFQDFFSFYWNNRARSLPLEMRVTGIRQLVSLAKEYTVSEEFKADYQKWRKNHNAIDSKDNENK